MGQAGSVTREHSHRAALEVAEASPAVLEDPLVQHYAQRGPLPDVGADTERLHRPTASELAYDDHPPAAKAAPAGLGHGGRVSASASGAHARAPARRGASASTLARLRQAGSALLDQVVMSAQELLDQMPGVRPLTPEEIERHRKIFGSSIDFDAVRVVEVGPVLLDKLHGGLTLGNYMLLLGNWQNRTALSHELTHVWQSQNGRYFKYIPEAAAALSHGDAAYDWGDEVRAGKAWSQLNPEQQAEYVRDTYYTFMSAAQFKPPVVCGAEAAVDPLASDPYFEQARHDLQCGNGAPGRRPKPPPGR